MGSPLFHGVHKQLHPWACEFGHGDRAGPSIAGMSFCVDRECKESSQTSPGFHAAHAESSHAEGRVHMSHLPAIQLARKVGHAWLVQPAQLGSARSASRRLPHAECPGCPARLSDYFGGSDLSVIATDFLNSVYIDVTIDHKSYQTRLAHFWQTVHGLKHFIQEHPYSLLILPHPEKSDDIFYNSLEVIYLLIQSIQRQDVQGVYKHFSLNHAPIMMKNPWLFQMLPIGSPVAAIDLIWQRAAVRSEIMCNLLADFPTYHYDAECSRIAFQIPAEPGLVVRCRAASEPDFSGGSSRALDSDVVNRILQFYNAASQGTAASLSLTRSCLGESRIRNKIIAYCIPAVPHDCFWAESIAHAVNNCASFTANHILRHPEPIRFFQL